MLFVLQPKKNSFWFCCSLFKKVLLEGAQCLQLNAIFSAPSIEIIKYFTEDPSRRKQFESLSLILQTVKEYYQDEQKQLLAKNGIFYDNMLELPIESSVQLLVSAISTNLKKSVTYIKLAAILNVKGKLLLSLDQKTLFYLSDHGILSPQTVLYLRKYCLNEPKAMGIVNSFHTFGFQNRASTKIINYFIPEMIEADNVLVASQSIDISLFITSTANNCYECRKERNDGISPELEKDDVEWVRSQLSKPHFKLVNQENKCPLLEAAAKVGAIDCFKFLVLNGAPLSLEVLDKAIESHNWEIIQHILEGGIEFAQSSLDIAIKSFWKDILIHIIENSKVIVSNSLETSLKCGNFMALFYLLDKQKTALKIDPLMPIDSLQFIDYWNQGQAMLNSSYSRYSYLNPEISICDTPDPISLFANVVNNDPVNIIKYDALNVFKQVSPKIGSTVFDICFRYNSTKILKYICSSGHLDLNLALGLGPSLSQIKMIFESANLTVNHSTFLAGINGNLDCKSLCYLYEKLEDKEQEPTDFLLAAIGQRNDEAVNLIIRLFHPQITVDILAELTVMPCLLKRLLFKNHYDLDTLNQVIIKLAENKIMNNDVLQSLPILIKYGADIDARNDKTSLLLSVLDTKNSRSKPDSNTHLKKHHKQPKKQADSKLHYLTKLLEIGANPNITVGITTPLLYAINTDNYDYVAALIQNGASVGFCSSSGKSPLDLVEGNCSESITDLLTKSVIEEGFRNASPRMVVNMIMNDSPEKCLIRIPQVLHLNSRDYEGKTPLVAAICRKDLSILQCVIDAGAALDVYSSWRNELQRSLNIMQKKECPILYSYPLQIAAALGYTEVVNILVKHDPKSVNYQDLRGWTPLSTLCLLNSTKSQRMEIAELLVEMGADLSKGAP